MNGPIRMYLRGGQKRGVACELVMHANGEVLHVEHLGREKALQWIAQLAEGLEWIDKPRA